jgi:hypothetical protein
MALIKDRASIEWIRIKEHSQKRLAELRADNDGDLDEVETARIRGMILMCKEIIALDQDKPVLENTNRNNYL